MARPTGFLLGLTLLFSLPAPAQEPASNPSEKAVVGRLLTPDAARMVVRREPCRCQPFGDQPDVLLLTLGTEKPSGQETEFHPLATLAFDRTLRDDETGEWLALWIFGPSPAGWRRTARSLLPLPVGSARASAGKLERLERRLEQLQVQEEGARRLVPDPSLTLANLGRIPRTHGILGMLRRGLKWASVFNPAQFIFRTYLERRGDDRGRRFQRTYMSLHWLIDLEFDGRRDAAWIATLDDMRFHLLRTRSFFARWIRPEDGSEMAHNYDSVMRERLGKSSSWLQSAANENYLRYQPIYRFAENGTPLPLGGVLYYDPRLPVGDPAWWGVGNPFDLPYNPHTHPTVQRLAQENPDQLIPLAVYTFQTDLAFRPTVVIDFIAPGNPRTRENNQQLMVLLRNWLAITTGAYSLERLPYRAVTWAANKKGFTLLTDKSARPGIEELRMSLESGLYFDPALRPWLLERVDRRVLNPLVKPGPVERLLARLQYASLRASDNQAICRTVERVRRKMKKRLGVSPTLPPEAQRAELARRLVAWHQLTRLRTLSYHLAGDIESLDALRAPLELFLRSDPPHPKKLAPALRDLYTTLYAYELRLPPPPRQQREQRQGRFSDDTLSRVRSFRALTRQAWQRVAEAGGTTDFEPQVTRVEQQAHAQHQKKQRAAQKQQLKGLRKLLHESRRELWRVARAGCDPNQASPTELEAQLTLLAQTIQVASQTEPFRTEIALQRPGLENVLAEVETALSQCDANQPDLWRPDFLFNNRRLAQALLQDLNRQKATSLTGDD